MDKSQLFSILYTEPLYKIGKDKAENLAEAEVAQDEPHSQPQIYESQELKTCIESINGVKMLYYAGDQQAMFCFIGQGNSMSDQQNRTTYSSLLKALGLNPKNVSVIEAEQWSEEMNSLIREKQSTLAQIIILSSVDSCAPLADIAVIGPSLSILAKDPQSKLKLWPFLQKAFQLS